MLREKGKEWPVSEWNRIECRKIMCEAMPQWSNVNKKKRNIFMKRLQNLLIKREIREKKIVDGKK